MLLPGHSAHSVISIHAPRTGSDAAFHAQRIAHLISIHAPRTGSDPCALRVRIVL